MKTYRFVALVLFSIVIAVLLATALTSFTRVSDSALADVATPKASVGASSSRPSTAGKNYLPIIFLNSATAGGAWLLAGNAGTNWLTDFLGTTDNMTLTIRVSNTIALRIAPSVDPVYGYTQNIIGGSASNAVLPGANGATIAGGGLAGYANVISPTGSYGFIGGGDTNAISGWESVIVGGYGNVAGGLFSMIGGGEQNVITSSHGTIAGGGFNKATGSYYSTIGGGYGNVASAQDATIAGGSGNTAGAFRSAIVGGNANQIGISGTNSFIGGGSSNIVNREFTVIAGGGGNSAAREYATISGGIYNTTNTPFAVIGGGIGNQVTGTANLATIAGGDHNTATGDHSTIAGGGYNSTSGLYYSTIGGGYGNNVSGQDATIAGGSGNVVNALRGAIGGGNGNRIAVTGTNAFIGGGTFNTANNQFATVSGGYFNSAGGDYVSIGGGFNNLATAANATIGGGYGSMATGQYATVAGGGFNVASGPQYSTVGGGQQNTASGAYATIPGGRFNQATESTAFAAGDHALALHQGAFVWADSSGTPFTSTASNQFIIRASGGVGVGTNAPLAQLHVSSSGGNFNPPLRVSETTPGEYVRVRLTNDEVSPADGYNNRWDIGTISTTLILYSGKYVQNAIELTPGGPTDYMRMGNSAHLTFGGAWTNASDKNMKANFEDVDAREVLAKVSELPITTWNYKAEPTDVRHLGPMAQDFSAAFGLGADDKSITTVDESGVALAAIKGLDQVVREKEARIVALEEKNQQELRELTELKERVGALEGQGTLGGDWAQHAVPLQWAAIAILAVMLVRRRR